MQYRGDQLDRLATLEEVAQNIRDVHSDIESNQLELHELVEQVEDIEKQLHLLIDSNKAMKDICNDNMDTINFLKRGE